MTVKTKAHATCVAVDGRGVLLRGPSGSGKSDLALRLIDGGAVLVADDYVTLSEDNGRIIATAPPTISGLMEVRGAGLFHVPHQTSAPVMLVADLTDPAAIPRLPDAETITMDAVPGINVRHIKVAPFEASSAAKIRLVLKGNAQ